MNSSHLFLLEEILHFYLPYNMEEEVPMISLKDLGKITAEAMHSEHFLKQNHLDKSNGTANFFDTFAVASELVSPTKFFEILKKKKPSLKIEYHQNEVENFFAEKRNTIENGNEMIKLGKALFPNVLSIEEWIDKTFLKKPFY